METLQQRFHMIRNQIELAEQHYFRSPSSVALLAVTKKRSVEEVRRLIHCGQIHLAESYLQEAIPKIEALEKEEVVWHFIGPIQSNKTKKIAQHFSWVHSVDRFKIAKRLSEHRSSLFSPLNICIQINVSQEERKSGVCLSEASGLVEAVRLLPNLRLRGLMAMSAFVQDQEQQRYGFKQVHQLFSALNRQGIHLDTLSMGMTHDFKMAIAEGSTLVRIGTALFGKRIG